MRRRSRAAWLLSAMALFAVAAWLMARGDPEAKAVPAPAERVSFPKPFDEVARARRMKRQTLPAPPPAAQPEAPPRPRDPVLAAFAASQGKSMVVLEANALFESPLGKLLLGCLRRDAGPDLLEEIRERAGVDLTRDLDRVATSGKVTIVSGRFERVPWSDLLPESRPRPLGDQATLYQTGSRGAFAVWKDQLVVTGESPEQIARAVDRIEGRAPPEAPALGEEAAYGELYGVLGADFFDEVLGREQPELAQRLREVAERIELHANAMGDVAVTAEVSGSSAEKMRDLASSFGGALALGRLKAQASGEKALSELLDLARVEPRGNRFTLELAMPMAWLEKQLAFCRAPKSPSGAPAPAQAGAAPSSEPP
jgi:hypothetical protein